MGLILDTGLFVRAERSGLSILDAIRSWSVLTGGSELGVSVITLTELAHAVPRAEDPVRSQARSKFIQGLWSNIPVYGIDEEIALSAGMIEGKLRNCGLTIGFADALIAATAVARGDGVATLNGKHFRLVPQLHVMEI